MSILRNFDRVTYTRIDNDLLEDSALSWEAKGLLSYLLSKPDGWEINQSHIESSGSAGKYKVRKIFAELYDAGYLEQVKRRTETGSFAGSETILHERPKAKNRNVVNRNVQKPESPFPGVSGNQPLVTTDLSLTTDSSNRAWGEVPDNIDQIAWQEWAAYKRGKPAQATITKTANFLRQYTPEQQRQVVDQSIRNTWKGLFPLKDERNGQTQRHHATPADLIDQRRRERAERIRQLESDECESGAGLVSHG